MLLVFLTRWDRQRQAVLARRQRTGCEFGKGTRRAIGLIEIDHDPAIGIGRINVKVTAGRISLFAVGLISEDHEKARLVLLADGIQPVLFSVY